MSLKLRIVLLFVFLISVILILEAYHFVIGLAFVGVALAGYSAWLYVQEQVTKPLARLNEQMKQITANNLRDRVSLGKGSSELQQIAGSFNAMLERLDKSFEIQKSFVHHASHELRTPLASMLSQTEAALNRNIDAAETKQVLQSLKEDQQELIELTNSLLLVSQYEKISASSEWPQVRLDQVLYDTVDLVKQLYPDLNCVISFSDMPENEQELSIKGNDSLLRSACKNLLKNAYQYGDKNVAVTIETNAAEIVIHFDNKGKILSPAEQDRLFIPFYRAGNAMGTKGFGLGLLIVQRTVLLHNGTISYCVPDANTNRFSISFKK